MTRLMSTILATTCLSVALYLTVHDTLSAATVSEVSWRPYAAQSERLTSCEIGTPYDDIGAGTKLEPPTPSLRPSVPAYVTALASGGYWEEGDRAGIVRVIVVQQGWEHVTSRVYLEWIEERPAHASNIIRQAPIDEINQAGVWSVDTPVLSPSPNGLVIDLPAAHMDLSEHKVFEVKIPVQGIGNFQVE